MLKINNLNHTYNIPGGKLDVLQNIDLSVKQGEFVIIMGESGSGKTTFINAVSTLLQPTSGEVYINNQDITALKGNELETLRLHDVSYIFQENYMVEGLTILENIIVSRLQYDEKASEKGLALMSKLGIEDLKDKYPHQISGGERQRAAICRALINEPKILFADEPTASLNPKTAKSLMESLQELNREGYTILMVTHSITTASYGSRLLVLADNNFKLDKSIPNENAHEFIVKNVAEYL
ncbi:MAG TPA: ABC transporter ATP-binding protein [Erysipelothrix sp.]|nr:ABC transporter ATP-binding protein [Erysipelothrix sp.]